MEKEERLKLVAAIEKCFFKGMKRGWASGAKAKPDFPFNGAKGYVYYPLATRKFDQHLDSLVLFDYFFVHPESRASYGTTIILYRGSSVWIMNYGGCYDKEAIPIVKKSLMAAYNNNCFLGGRGVDMVDGDLEYENNILPHDDSFGRFDSEETVRNIKTGEELGGHLFHGGLLI